MNNPLYPSLTEGFILQPGLAAGLAGRGNYHFTTNISVKVAPVLYTYNGFGADNDAHLSLEAPGFSDTFVGQGAVTGVQGAPAAGWSGYPAGSIPGSTLTKRAFGTCR